MCPILVDVPVHCRCLFVEHLHAVESNVPQLLVRTPVDHDGESNEASCIPRPALQNGDYIEIHVVAGEDHFLA